MSHIDETELACQEVVEPCSPGNDMHVLDAQLVAETLRDIEEECPSKRRKTRSGQAPKAPSKNTSKTKVSSHRYELR